MTRSPHHAIAMMTRLLLGTLLALAALTPAQAQEPGNVLVGIYHVAPGKHLDFLRWQAARDAAAVEAGGAATQWYVHTDGDSWDFISIAPEGTPQMDEKVQAVLQR